DRGEMTRSMPGESARQEPGSTVTVTSYGARRRLSWPNARSVYAPGLLKVALTATLPSTTFTYPSGSNVTGPGPRYTCQSTDSVPCTGRGRAGNGTFTGDGGAPRSVGSS